MNFADAAITYGANGIRCGCGKPAHSNLVECAISDEELAGLATLLAAPNVAPGPWIADGHEINQDGRVKLDEWVGETCNVELPDTGAANAALIVAARNALPGLLAEIARLRARVAELTPTVCTCDRFAGHHAPTCHTITGRAS